MKASAASCPCEAHRANLFSNRYLRGSALFLICRDETLKFLCIFGPSGLQGPPFGERIHWNVQIGALITAGTCKEHGLQAPQHAFCPLPTGLKFARVENLWYALYETTTTYLYLPSKSPPRQWAGPCFQNLYTLTTHWINNEKLLQGQKYLPATLHIHEPKWNTINKALCK